MTSSMDLSGMDLSKMPAISPPPGEVVDFNSPVNRATMYIAVSSVVVSLAFIFVVLKLYMRLFVLRKPGWDDLASVIGLLGLVSWMGIYTWILDRGAGRHMWDIPLSLALKEINLSKTLAIIQQPTSLATKLALLGLYYRLFSPKREIKYVIIGGMVVCCITYIVIMAIWITIPNSSTGVIMINRINKAQGALNLTTDLYIFVVPLVAISGLKMSRSQKIGVAAVFMTGSLAVAACVISIVYRSQYISASGDLSWQLVPFYIVLTVEISVGLMCGCMPVFPALLQKSGVSKWWTATYKSLTSKLLGSPTGTAMSSIKKSSPTAYKSSSKGEEYVQLREAKSIQKHIQIEVRSMRDDSSMNPREYV